MVRSALSNRPLLRLVIAAVVFAGVVWGSYLIIPAGSLVSLVWPPSAVGLAFVFLFGYEILPGLFVPLFLILLVRGAAPPVALGVTLANLIEYSTGAFLLRQLEFDPLISRLRDAMTLVCAALGSTLVSSTVLTLVSAYAGGQSGEALWLSLWIGHAVSLLAFAPFALYWGNRPFFWKKRTEALEGIAVFGGIALVLYASSWLHEATIGPFAVIYILVVLLIWASLRTGPRGIGLALAMTVLGATIGIVYNPMAGESTAQTLLQTQILIGVLSLIFLPFTSIVEERKNAVIALRTHIEGLQDAVEKIRFEDEAKSEFIAILAHELRNPLSPILSTLELMKQEKVSENNLPYLTSIASHVHVMARLLDDLLDTSRVSQKKFKLERTPVELGAVITGALAMAKPLIDNRRHMVSASLPHEPLWLDADPVRLEQIFVNILNNAAKYTDPGGTIKLTASREGNAAVVRITDNGVGIEPERLPHVFDSFGGAEGAARSRGGLRIGLSLAKRMVELHHGTIEAKSGGAGKGSEFIVTLPLPITSPLPLRESPQPARARYSPEALRAHTENKQPLKVLVVDDNEAAAQSLGALLRRNGHLVELAFDGGGALKAARDDRPDAVLLDIGLPDLNGHEVGKRLRAEHGKKLIIVALTGYGQAQDRQKAALAGFDKHLTKPASILDVERTLAELRR